MPEVVSAVYEGNGLVRLSHEPEGIRPQEHLTVLIVPIPTSKKLSIEKAGLDGLRQQILDFETRYSLGAVCDSLRDASPH